MFLGLFAVGLAFAGVTAAGNSGAQVAQFKQDHPIVALMALFLGAYMIVYLLDGIVVFLFGVLLPISATFIHASLRMRSLRNKLANKMEQVGLKGCTPMGMLLDSLGFEAELVE